MQSTDYLSNEKRARPSGTHSYWYLGRTNLNTQRKTRPDGHVNRRHIFRLRKTAKISYEHMQRNAKSQAVTGEPGWAGSSPITPAATTPQPAGRSIANSAAIWRRGIIVRLFECSIGVSGAEEVVEGHFGLDDAGMGVPQESGGCHHRQMDRRACLRHLLKRAQLGLELGQVRLLDRKGPGRELHLADVDHMVGPFDQHVNLGPHRIGIVRNMMPAIDLRQHPRNTKRGLDLRDMPEADTLERQPTPGVYTRGIDRMLPIMLIGIGLPFKELQVKERKAVDQLVLSIAFALSVRRWLSAAPRPPSARPPVPVVHELFQS